MLQSHYRSPLEVTGATIESAESALDRLDSLARRARDLPQSAPDAAEMDEFRAHMDDNLDTPAVCAQLFGMVSEANRLLDAGDDLAAAPVVAAWREILGALGLEVRGEAAEVPDDVAELARQRDVARAARDFATADSLRDRIAAAGFTAEDGPDGTVVRPA